jgi:hypothetical protein
MPFVPDIVVTGPDSPRILVAVEAKTDETQFEDAAKQIRYYLSRMSRPLGLIVFPARVWVFRNTYSGLDESAVQQLGPFELPKDLWEPTSYSPGSSEARFEEAVQDWLERLATAHDTGKNSSEFQSILEQWVLPSLTSGVVRAAGPRTFARK